MTTKNIQDVVAELDLILDDIETDNDNGEHNVGYYRSSYKDRLEKAITQLVKEVEAGERERCVRYFVGNIMDGFDADAKYKEKVVIEHIKALTPPTSDEALQDNK